MRIILKVHPRARRTRFSGGPQEYKLEVTAPPDDGKANDAVVAFFARGLRLPRSAVRIVSGERSRRKVVEVAGATEADISRIEDRGSRIEE